MKTTYLLLTYFLFGLVAHGQPLHQSSNTNIGNSMNAVVNKPTGTMQNDLMIIGIMYEKGNSETISSAPGWILIRRTDNGANCGMATYYKVAGISEPSSYSFSFSNGSKWSIGISRITGANITVPVDVSGGSTGFGSSVTAPSITTTSDKRLLLCFYTNKKFSTYNPSSGITEKYDRPNLSEGTPSNMMAVTTQTTAGATGNKTAMATDSEFWASQQVAISDGYALPVKWTSFQVEKISNNYTLKWSVAEEMNAAFYEVQRSEDGWQWQAISRVNAFGTTSTAKNYSYVDKGVTLRNIYYRIKQVDQDGKFEFTQIRSYRNNDIQVSIYPTKEGIQVYFKEKVAGRVQFHLYSLNGQLVSTQMQTNPSGQVLFTTDKDVQGIYIVVVTNHKDFHMSSKVFIDQR
jgi:hypothetical protein